MKFYAMIIDYNELIVQGGIAKCNPVHVFSNDVWIGAD